MTRPVRPICALRASRALAVLAVAGLGASADAGVIFGFSGAGLGGGYRWDAAPRMFNLGGSNYERSLNGGLRFSLQGGSYQAYRDLFTWSSVPTVPAFTAAVNQAFNAWTVVDPATGLGTTVSFVSDLGTPVVGTAAGGGLDNRGAEIDLFGRTDANSWNPGSSGQQGESYFNAFLGPVTLTSGTPGYPGGGAIAGADVTMNSNPQAVWSLDVFRRVLTHEIGHAIGLGDVEGSINPGAFIDDNMDLSSSASAQATLTNSWALMVNVLNPAASMGLSRYTATFGNPGTTTPGVDILMESNGVGIGAGNPVTNLTPMTNDDFGTRQFLYPTLVPSPASFATAMIALGCLTRRRRASR